MRNALLMSFLTLALSACSFKPMSVYVKPKLAAPQAAPAQVDQLIRLTVVDERESSDLGSRTISGKTAAISSQNDLLAALKKAFVESYTQQGFTFASVQGEGVPEVSLILLKTDYVSHSKALGGTTTTLNTELQVKARNAAKTYEKSYRSSAENKTAFTPMQDAIQEMVNAALTDVLQRAVNDKQVQAVLLASE